MRNLNATKEPRQHIYIQKEKIKKEIYDLINENSSESIIKERINDFYLTGANTEKPSLQDLLIDNTLYTVIMMHGGIKKKENQNVTVPNGMDIYRVSPTKIGICNYAPKEDLYHTFKALTRSLQQNKSTKNIIKDVIPIFDSCRKKNQKIVMSRPMNQGALEYCQTHKAEVQHRKEGKRIINKNFQIIFNEHPESRFSGIFIISPLGIFDLIDYIPKENIHIKHKEEFYVLETNLHEIIDTVERECHCTLVTFDLSCSSRPEEVSPNTFMRDMREIESRSRSNGN